MTIFFILYFLMLNSVGLYLMHLDKQKAVSKQWRVPESNLFFICYAGGFIGIFLGMKYFRHKTKHWQFHVSVIISAISWVLLLPALYYVYVVKA